MTESEDEKRRQTYVHQGLERVRDYRKENEDRIRMQTERDEKARERQDRDQNSGRSGRWRK